MASRKNIITFNRTNCGIETNVKIEDLRAGWKTFNRTNCGIETKVPKFKAGKYLKEAVNTGK